MKKLLYILIFSLITWTASYAAWNSSTWNVEKWGSGVWGIANEILHEVFNSTDNGGEAFVVTDNGGEDYNVRQ